MGLTHDAFGRAWKAAGHSGGAEAVLKGEAAREAETQAVRAEVKALCESFPMPGATPAAV